MRVAGLMSGTSFDAIDAAVADLELAGDEVTLRPLGSLSAPYDDDLRAEIAARRDGLRRLPARRADRPGVRRARGAGAGRSSARST